MTSPEDLDCQTQTSSFSQNTDEHDYPSVSAPWTLLLVRLTVPHDNANQSTTVATCAVVLAITETFAHAVCYIILSNRSTLACSLLPGNQHGPSHPL